MMRLMKIPSSTRSGQPIKRHHLALVVLLALCACWPLSAAGKLNVVAATMDLASIATEVGGDRVNVISIA